MKRVLIVDDSPSVLKILRTSLEIDGYEVEQANNAEEAIVILQTKSFDFGIFDINMPGKNGIELTSIALSMPNGKNMKIIILTSESADSIKLKGEEAGASAWMVKPFDDGDLMELLSQLSED